MRIKAGSVVLLILLILTGFVLILIWLNNNYSSYKEFLLDKSILGSSITQDDQFIAVPQGNTVVKLSSTNGEILSTFNGHLDSVIAVSISADASLMASGSYDRTVKIWNFDNGQLIRSFTGSNQAILSVAFSPDMRSVASGSADNIVYVWDVRDGHPSFVFREHADRVVSTTFSHNGRSLASGSWDKTVKIWDMDNGTLIKTFTGHDDRVCSVAWSLDDSKLISGSWDNTVRVWDVRSGNILTTLSGHTKAVCAVASSPDGKFLVSASGVPPNPLENDWLGDNTIRIWRIDDWSLAKTINAHSNVVTSLMFTSASHILISTSLDKTIKFWRLE